MASDCMYLAKNPTELRKWIFRLSDFLRALCSTESSTWERVQPIMISLTHRANAYSVTTDHMKITKP